MVIRRLLLMEQDHVSLVACYHFLFPVSLCCFYLPIPKGSGATTRVNCQLRKPVKVNQILKVVGTVREREGRKTHIEGKLIGGDGSIHATLDGITVAVTREQLMS